MLPASEGAGEAIRGVQSVEVAVRLLSVLAAAGGPMALSDLAAAAGMAPAKAHRYLASLSATAMVEHRRSGSYDLGRRAAEIGIAAVARFDPVNRIADRMADLVDAADTSAMLSVWGAQGPTVIRWERGRRALVTMLGVGSVFPVLTSATGRAFLAHLPERVVAPLAATEPGGLDAFTEARRRHRGQMLFAAEASLIPGLYALARPVLDVTGVAAAVATLVSTDPATTDPGSKAANALRRFV